MRALATPAAAQDAARGAALIFNSDKGNCTICHAIPGLGLPEDAQGDIGPPLAGVGARWSQADLATIITDPRPFMPDTIMPAYGVTAGLRDVAVAYHGQPILTEAEIADIAAYLAGLQ
jgi:sulfur-oxidizing protein SoxX